MTPCQFIILILVPFISFLCFSDALLTANKNWIDNGLLLSSFNDGLKSNPTAKNWLMNHLTDALWKEEQIDTQRLLEESNVASPCNGPDPVILEKLENIDRFLIEQQQQETLQYNDDDVDERNNNRKSWKKKLELLCEMKRNKTNNTSHSNCPLISLRILYIPTAMYALRPESSTKPRKQRERNRADAKKRRTDIIRLLENQLEEQQHDSYLVSDNKDLLYNISTITLDFDDGSVKQPQVVTVGPDMSSQMIDTDHFPKTGKEAIREWEPHLIYVQGGNTFWLHYCMNKNDWDQDLINACSCNSSSSIYCGVSAGAIIAGRFMQPACWKQLDNPSVVPGRETFDDWNDILGLDITGGDSFFPHMQQHWEEMIVNQTRQLQDNNGVTTLHCIQDSDAYVVNGRKRCVQKI